MAKRSAGPQASLFSRLLGGAVGVGFVLFWSAFVGVFDFFVGRDIVRQLSTYGYAATHGTITRCDVEANRSAKKGAKYSLHVEYSYLVGDREYQGDRYRYRSTDDRGDGKEIQQRMPVGSRQTVYYDRDEPQRAVLLRGLEGHDLFLPMFLTPFNLIMVGGLSAIYFTWFPRPAREETGGVPVRDDGLMLRAFVPDNSALFVFSLAVFGMSFGMTFVVGLAAGGFEPRLGVMIAVWGLIFAVAIWFAAPRLYRDWTGQSDLVIDRFGKRLTLPVTHGRKQPLEVRFDAIESITIKDVCKVDNEGDATHTYEVLLRERGAEQIHCIWVASEEAKAKQFLTWLRGTLGIAADLRPALSMR